MVPVLDACNLPEIAAFVAQLVYSGAVDAAADFFAELGYAPDSSAVNIADYMLDTVIRSPPAEVDHMVAHFKESVPPQPHHASEIQEQSAAGALGTMLCKPAGCDFCGPPPLHRIRL